MTPRTLGDRGLYPVCLGGNVFGWTADFAASCGILDAYTEAGGNFIDTADAYSAWAPGNSGGESEDVLGRWMEGRRNRENVIIATKVAKLPEHRGLAPATIRAAVHDSLARLRTDYIDLYYAHEYDDTVPLADTLAAFSSLVDAGLIRHYGVSNFTGAQLAEACEIAAAQSLHAPAAIQPRYNLVDRAQFEGDIAPVAAARGVSVFSFYGLAAGFLTGKYSADISPTGERSTSVQHYGDPARWAALDVVRDIAASHGSEPAAVALAWLLAQPAVTAPIASVSHAAQLPGLLSATTLRLSDQDIKALDAATADLPRTAFDT